jgi:hypothetical protein
MDMTSLRSFRIFGIALFDLVLSMVIMTLIFLYIAPSPPLSRINFIIAAIILTIPLGIVVHVLFGINTTLNYYLGLSNKPK